MKIKRHRFYERMLKSEDPIFISIGWRRFQTIPIFFNEEQSGRLRYLKYAPELLTCYATYFGPKSIKNAGLVAFYSINENLQAFRISGTGSSIEQIGNGQVVKKLRITGYPKDIHKKTAMVSNMFSSDVEASEFLGGLVRTVSGIRGEIKHAEKNGVVRCSFESQLVKSDIVFLNGWIKVKVKEFYSMLTNFASQEKDFVRSFAQLRSDLNLKPIVKEDSL